MDPLNNTTPAAPAIIPGAAPVAPAPASGATAPTLPAGAGALPSATPAVVPTGATQGEAANAAAQKAGLDMATLSKTWAEKGDLTEEDYAKFEAAGLTRELVRQGCQAIANENQQKVTAYRTAAADHVGGIENLTRLKDFFLTADIPQEQKDQINSMIRMDNVVSTKAALSEIQKLYAQKYGNTGNPVDGERTTGTGDVFATFKEQNEAILKAQRSGDKSALDSAVDKAARTAAHNRKAGIKW